MNARTVLPLLVSAQWNQAFVGIAPAAEYVPTPYLANSSRVKSPVSADQSQMEFETQAPPAQLFPFANRMSVAVVPDVFAHHSTVKSPVQKLTVPACTYEFVPLKVALLLPNFESAE